MPYIEDDSQIKCDLDALYSGDLVLEAGYTEAAGIIGLSQGAPAPFAMVFPDGITGWDSVDRTCGD